jgi:hypothetical protein
MRTFDWAAAALLASMLASCGPLAAPSTGTGGFSGATSSSTGFTSTSDGCTYSFLFDSFHVERRASADDMASAAASHTARANLKAPAHVAGAQVALHVRGALLGDGAAGELQVSFAGAAQTFALSGEPGSFAHTFTAPAVAGDNELQVTASLPEGDNEAVIQIDSVDLAVEGASFCGAAG